MTKLSQMSRRLLTAFALGTAALATTACGPRVQQTEVAIKTAGYGKTVEVVTEPGKQCYLGCGFGVDFVMFTKGEQPVNVIGIQPNQKGGEDTRAAYGVIKVSEGLPLSGGIQFILKLDITEKNKGDLEELYRAIPPKAGEADEEYFDRILRRMATLALSETQDVYGAYSVKDATRTTLTDGETTNPVNTIEALLKQKTQERFIKEGFGFFQVKTVITTGINLGPQAEAANQRIAMAGIEKTAAGEQMKAAKAVKEAANEMAGITAEELKALRAAAGDGQNLDSLYCLHKTARDPNFAVRNTNCFPGMNMKIGK